MCFSNLTLAGSRGQEGGREAGAVHGLAAGVVVLVVRATDWARRPRRLPAGRAIVALCRPAALSFAAVVHTSAPHPSVLAAALVATDRRHFSMEELRSVFERAVLRLC